MELLTNRSKLVTNKQMTFAEKLYIPAILGGLRITIRHFFKKKVTVCYPEEKREHSKIFRGRHVLKRDDLGRENCTACGLCAIACPAEAITIVAEERKKGEEHLYREEKYAAEYNINMLRCIFCGLCEEACPKDAIYLTDRISLSNYERNQFLYTKEMLVEGSEGNERINIDARRTGIRDGAM
ncbi:MAG: NADH-quinone oxidoreductase subunit NuoI [Saprospiraceae bacterium]|nr:NADH-quinone oxidoreductase subunit NuoI [Saprospiraceae bacterium]